MFSHLMDAVLAGLTWWTCFTYLDNVIVYALTWATHLQRLRTRDAGLKLKPSKCCTAQNKVHSLGHLVSSQSQGNYLDLDKLQAIHNIPPPTNVQALCSFLCLASYYRRFVKGFTDVATPLHRLLVKGVTWSWSSDCNQAFWELKDQLTQPPIVSYPDFSLSFRLYTDASNEGLGPSF